MCFDLSLIDHIYSILKLKVQTQFLQHRAAKKCIKLVKFVNNYDFSDINQECSHFGCILYINDSRVNKLILKMAS